METVVDTNFNLEDLNDGEEKNLAASVMKILGEMKDGKATKAVISFERVPALNEKKVCRVTVEKE